MKTNNFLALVIALTASVYAGVYFDAGFGLGVGSATEGYLNDDNPYRSFPAEVDRGPGVGFDIGIRAGNGFPNIGSGLFIVGELGLEISSYVSIATMLGPGIIFYPITNIQLGASFGLSGILSRKEEPYIGPAYNVSVAYDFSKLSHGALLGVKYYHISSRNVGNVEEIESSTISVFAKYTFRKKKGASIADEESRQQRKALKAAKIADKERKKQK